MSGKSSQAKGRRGEYELSKIFNTYGIDARPGEALNFGTEPDVVGVTGIHIECKRVEKLNLFKAIQQSVRDSKKFHDGLPCVFHRKNRTGWLVTMPLSDWMKLYNAAMRR